MKKPTIHICGVLLVLLWATVPSLAETPRLGIPEILPSQDFLWRQLPQYNNYAFQGYSNYPDHTFPYADRPRAFYDSFGDPLITGYDLYDWTERRTLGQEYGSSIFKDRNQWSTVFDFLVVGRDSYNDWGYSAIVGDGLIARFTPLTLSQVDFNGARFDLATPYARFTFLGSRIERPHFYIESVSPWAIENTHFADDSTILLGTRLETDIGALRLGLNGVNTHVYQSTQDNNSLKGSLRPKLPSMDQIVVRFTDDSPHDGRGGALVQEAQLILNGEARPDIVPTVIRHFEGVDTQVGTISRLTGQFNPTIYTNPRGYYQIATLYYRGRNDMPLFADYLYRADHEAGIDVSKNTNLEGLLATFKLESPEEILQADGNEHLVFLFDLSQEPYVESVAVEAALANDYQVEVATLNLNNPRGRGYPNQYVSTFYRTVLRAEGNVQDGSNLARRRINVGENTSLFTYSADMHLALAGLEVNGEYARSARYSRFPARMDETALYDRGPRFSEQGSAWYINAVRWFKGGRLGAEAFATNPDFHTEMRTFVPFEIGLTETTLAGLANNTIFWDLVQDNEDGDRYPDKRVGNLQGQPNDREDEDIDGVFPGQDDDNDGLPDTNRNFNDVPDYVEPFLMYYVESNDFFYGLDRNNNDDPDVREDDLDPDYPYDADQRGIHLFGQLDLTPQWSLGAGRYDIEQIAGGGRNKSTYALVNYRREELGRLQRLFFENHLRRVKDDIADEFSALVERPKRIDTDFRGLVAGNKPSFTNNFRADPLLYRNSYVNDTYLESWLNPWSTLQMVHKVRLRFNWQQAGPLPGGLVQRDKRLDFFTWVSRADYTWHWHRLQIQPQFKILLLRLVDQAADRQLDGRYARRTVRSELSVIPILRCTLPLMQRSQLQLGIQGLGPLPYRVEDRVNARNSFDQHTLYLNVNNRSKYFGYDLRTIVGLQREVKTFDEESRESDAFDALTFFARVLIGFTEYGRLL